jgi:hypothetical protein
MVLWINGISWQRFPDRAICLQGYSQRLPYQATRWPADGYAARDLPVSCPQCSMHIYEWQFPKPRAAILGGFEPASLSFGSSALGGQPLTSLCFAMSVITDSFIKRLFILCNETANRNSAAITDRNVCLKARAFSNFAQTDLWRTRSRPVRTSRRLQHHRIDDSGEVSCAVGAGSLARSHQPQLRSDLRDGEHYLQSQRHDDGLRER